MPSFYNFRSNKSKQSLHQPRSDTYKNTDNNQGNLRRNFIRVTIVHGCFLCMAFYIVVIENYMRCNDPNAIEQAEAKTICKIHLCAVFGDKISADNKNKRPKYPFHITGNKKSRSNSHGQTK